jgi:hypothetical protein
MLLNALAVSIHTYVYDQHMHMLLLFRHLYIHRVFLKFVLFLSSVVVRQNIAFKNYISKSNYSYRFNNYLVNACSYNLHNISIKKPPNDLTSLALIAPIINNTFTEESKVLIIGALRKLL